MHNPFSFFLYLLSQLWHKWQGGTPSSLSITGCVHSSQRGEVVLPLAAFSCTHTVTTRGVLPPLSAHFLAFDPTRGGRPPLSLFFALITMRGGHPPIFSYWTQRGEVVLPSHHFFSYSTQQHPFHNYHLY